MLPHRSEIGTERQNRERGFPLYFTGECPFPNALAAQNAVDTVRYKIFQKTLDNSMLDRLICNHGNNNFQRL